VTERDSDDSRNVPLRHFAHIFLNIRAHIRRLGIGHVKIDKALGRESACILGVFQE